MVRVLGIILASLSVVVAPAKQVVAKIPYM